MIEKKISDLLDLKFQESEFESYFLIEVELKGGNRLEVYLDGDQGITLGNCQIISRYLEKHLDEELWLGEKYFLEVSSPGVKRALKFPRQYYQHIGRKLEVKTNEEGVVEGSKVIVEGTLTDVNDSQITLEWKDRVKEGKKKKTVEMKKEIPFDLIENTIVKLSFNKGKYNHR